MDYLYLIIFIFIGVLFIHTTTNYPDRFLIYPPIKIN